ncbi:hypothetical protein QBC43DRAFT_220211 [Cladorrhinum sp. PSN259]|nr:hypothetical protein QBC43DRAFT_220211 [Cladorrhinum sp. PSN259]
MSKSKSPPTPINLYHTTLSITSHHHDSSGGSTRSSHILGTHTDLLSARSFALSCLESSLNYHPSDFAKFITRLSYSPSPCPSPSSSSSNKEDENKQEWPYGDNTLVYALTHSGQEFLVGLEEKPNISSLKAGGPDGTPLLPKNSVCDHLHYVLQTTTHYDQAMDTKDDAFQNTEIEGCYIPRSEALNAARKALRQEKEKGMFAQYDERDEIDRIGLGDGDEDECKKNGWPFGEDVVVHAVGQMGENYEVAVRTVPGAKRRRSKVVF